MKRDEDVYDAIIRHIEANGYAPTVRELSEMTGIKSISEIVSHLENLVIDEKIEKKEMSPRAIRVLGYKFIKEQ